MKWKPKPAPSANTKLSTSSRAHSNKHTVALNVERFYSFARVCAWGVKGSATQRVKLRAGVPALHAPNSHTQQ